MSKNDEKRTWDEKMGTEDALVMTYTVGSTCDVQKRVLANKIGHRFNASDIPKEFCLMYGEVAEAFEAWKNGFGLNHKLADVAIFLFGIAEITGIDLGKAIDEQLRNNEPHPYEQGTQEWYDSLPTEMKDHFMDGIK